MIFKRDRFEKELGSERPYKMFVVIFFTFVFFGILLISVEKRHSGQVLAVVEGVGIDTAHIYQPSNMIVTVSLPTGETARVELPVGITVKVGDKIVVNEARHLITNAKAYTYANIQR